MGLLPGPHPTGAALHSHGSDFWPGSHFGKGQPLAIGGEGPRELKVLAPRQRLWFAGPVRPCPEHASGRLEDHEPSVWAPHRSPSHNTAGQTRLAASLPVVDPDVRARPLTRCIGQAAAVRRETGEAVTGRLKIE